MALETQAIDLGSVAHVGCVVDISGARDADDAMVLTGKCFAYDVRALINHARRQQRPWHLLLLESSIVGLRHQNAKMPLLVGYQVLSSLTRLFVLSKQEHDWRKLHEIARTIPGYVESGTDGLPANALRPLVYWEWPDTMIALWPTGPEGETAEPRVVDTGSLESYWSVHESEMALPVEMAGVDHIRVPRVPDGSLNRGDRSYRYLNRWASIQWSGC